MLDVLQVVGALAVLIPYMWTLLGHLSPRAITYLFPNLIGASLLAAIALHGQDWGFLLLEGSWAAVAAYTLVRLTRSEPA